MNKILSLDFWGTIAVFNPQYSKARTELFAERLKLPSDEAHARYQFVKRRCDHDAEHHGTSVTPLVAMQQVLADSEMDAAFDPVSVLEELENLVRKYPPILDWEIAGCLMELQIYQGWTVGVSSNTNFIRGSLIEEIFHDELRWDFAVYSDVLGVSKPHPDFFRTVMKEARAAAKNRSIFPEEMIHIGDNTACDVRGAEQVGMQGILTKSPKQTVDMLNRLIKGENLAQDHAQ